MAKGAERLAHTSSLGCKALCSAAGFVQVKVSLHEGACPGGLQLARLCLSAGPKASHHPEGAQQAPTLLLSLLHSAPSSSSNLAAAGSLPHGAAQAYKPCSASAASTTPRLWSARAAYSWRSADPHEHPCVGS